MWLTSPRAVAREGRAMQHSVASYTEECADRQEHVASIRDLAGQRKSTLRVYVCALFGGSVVTAMGRAPRADECAAE